MSRNFYTLLLLCFIATFQSVTAQVIQGALDYGVFPRTDKMALLDIYMSINGETINFNKSSEGRKAEVEVTTFVKDSTDKIYYVEKTLLQSPVLKDTVNLIPNLFDQQKTLLPYGNYIIEVRMKDLNSKDSGITGTLNVALIAPDTGVIMSSVQLLSHYEKSDSDDLMNKNGYTLISKVSNFYPKEVSVLKLYTELYGVDKVIGEEEPFVVFFKFVNTNTSRMLAKEQGFSRHKSARLVPLLAEINISKVPSGNYMLLVEARDKNNNLIIQGRKFIQRSNFKDVKEPEEDLNTEMLPESAEGTFAADIPDSAANMVLRAIRPASTQREIDMSNALIADGTTEQKRSYLVWFFKKRNPDDSGQAYREYISRLREADRKFSTKSFRSFETDRGRVYLQYGAPNRIETELTDFRRVASRDSNPIPFEIWTYYNVPSSITHIAQTNRTFVFLEDNRGNNAWRLVHSDAIGELNNPAWRDSLPRNYMNVDDIPRNNFGDQ